MKIAIVGAGIMGQLTALALVNAGHDLTLFEKNSEDDLNNCSMAAAGMLTASIELEKSEKLIYELGCESLNSLWPKIIEGISTEVYFRRKGALLVAHPQDKTELDRFMNTLLHRSVDRLHCEKLNSAALQTLEPELEKFNEAYYFPEEGQIDNQALIKVLIDDLRKLSVRLCFKTLVKEVKPHQIMTENSTENFDWVIDCRGLGAKSIFNELRGVRGELIWVKAPEVKIEHLVRLLHPRYSLYIVPRPDHIYIIGASEIESEDQGPISVRTALELLSAAFYCHPGFSEARIIKTMTHCRPTLKNHLPKIKYRPGLIAVNGLYRHGFLIAPALANELRHYLETGAASIHYPQLWESIDEVH